jgi:hypothetical protein
MTLSMEAKKWLLNERKRQQIDDKIEKSSSKKDTIKVPEKDRTNSSNMPNQYAKVKKRGGRTSSTLLTELNNLQLEITVEEQIVICSKVFPGTQDPAFTNYKSVFHMHQESFIEYLKHMKTFSTIYCLRHYSLTSLN